MKGKKLALKMQMARRVVGYFKEVSSYTEGISEMSQLMLEIRDFWATEMGAFIKSYLVDYIDDNTVSLEFNRMMQDRKCLMVNDRQVPVARISAANGHVAIILWGHLGFGFDSRRKAGKKPIAFIESWQGHMMAPSEKVRTWATGWSPLFGFGYLTDTRDLEAMEASYRAHLKLEQEAAEEASKSMAQSVTSADQAVQDSEKSGLVLLPSVGVVDRIDLPEKSPSHGLMVNTPLSEHQKFDLMSIQGTPSNPESIIQSPEVR